MRNRIRYPFTVLLVGSLFVANVSCTRVVRIPTDEIKHVQANEAEQWRVRTTDEHVYVVARFSVTDSTFVIEELGGSIGAVRQEGNTPATLPYVLRLEQIASLEKFEPTEPLNSIFVVSFVTVTLVAVIFVASISSALD